MKIQDHYSLKVARDVIRKIDITAKMAKMIHAESWANCREQGLSLFVGLGLVEEWKRINIAQNRNSDDIVVIVGVPNDFELGNNQPYEETWKNRRLFRYDEQQNAADYIKAIIVEAYKSEVIKQEAKKKTPVKA
jgi:hypothetical protein